MEEHGCQATSGTLTVVLIMSTIQQDFTMGYLPSLQAPCLFCLDFLWKEN